MLNLSSSNQNHLNLTISSELELQEKHKFNNFSPSSELINSRELKLIIIFQLKVMAKGQQQNRSQKFTCQMHFSRAITAS